MSGRGDGVTALAEVRAGRPAIVVTEGRADLVLAAELATAKQVAFLIRYTSGLLCVALPPDDCDRLRLAPMYPFSTDPTRGAFTVSVDAVNGVSTGISSADRARTVRLLGDPATSAADLARPGHVVCSRVAAARMHSRPGPAEAASDLVGATGLRPVAVYSTIVSAGRSGDLMRGTELTDFAAGHRLAVVTADDVARRRCRPPLSA